MAIPALLANRLIGSAGEVAGDLEHEVDRRKSKAPQRHRTATPWTRRSCSHIGSTNSASWMPSACIRLSRAVLAVWLATGTEPGAGDGGRVAGAPGGPPPRGGAAGVAPGAPPRGGR